MTLNWVDVDDFGYWISMRSTFEITFENAQFLKIFFRYLKQCVNSAIKYPIKVWIWYLYSKLASSINEMTFHPLPENRSLCSHLENEPKTVDMNKMEITKLSVQLIHEQNSSLCFKTETESDETRQNELHRVSFFEKSQLNWFVTNFSELYSW